MNETPPELSLPGFRFHPTEEELLDFYLRKVVFGEKLPFNVIGLLNIYHYEPWELPEMAKNGEREWYFYVIRERKHGNGGRPSRTTEHGFWKATGSDRQIRSISHPKRLIGLRKTLVFYKGRAQRGSCKTEWIMNEYRMPPSCSLPKNDMVLCKIYRKATPLRILEQKAAMEEEKMRTQEAYSSTQTMDSTSLPYQQQDNLGMPISAHDNVFVFKAEAEEEEAEQKEEREDEEANSSLRGDFVKESLPELQVPNFSLDWTQDPLWTQLCSPWLDIWTPYMNALNS